MKIKILASVLVLVLLFSCVPSALAEGQTIQIVISERQSMAFSFTYDVEEPTVSFTAPNGDVYGQEALDKGTMWKEAGEGFVTYYIPDAEGGTWTVTYDKGRNQTLELTYAPFALAPEISSFSVDRFEKEKVLLSYALSYEGTGKIYYTVYAVTEENGAIVGRRALSEGRMYNRDGTLSVSLSKLPTYGAYRLELEVYVNDGNIKASNTALSEPFSYTSADEAELPGGIVILAGISEEFVRIDWSRSDRLDSYVVGAFYEGEAEPFFSAEYDYKQKGVEFAADFSRGAVVLELTGRNNSRNTATKRYRLQPSGSITFGQTGTTNAAQTMVSYASFADGTSARLLVSPHAPEHSDYYAEDNGAETLIISGDGTFSVALPTMESYICVLWQEGEIHYAVGATVYSDRMPPLLYLWEHTAPLTVDADSFEIVGKTQSGCTVQISSKGQVLAALSVDDSGSFRYEVGLSVGSNLFDITVTDGAGNQSAQVIELIRRSAVAEAAAAVTDPEAPDQLTKLWNTISQWRYVMIAALMSGLAIVLTFIFTARFRKNKTRFGAVAAWCRLARGIYTVLGVLALAVCGWTFYQYYVSDRFIHSRAFFELAQKSVDEAYEAQQTVGLWKERLELWLLIAAGALGIGLLMYLLPRLLRGMRKKPEQKQQTQQPDRTCTPVQEPQSEPEPEQSPAAQAQSIAVCPACGSPLEPDCRFCSNCGTQIEDTI